MSLTMLYLPKELNILKDMNNLNNCLYDVFTFRSNLNKLSKKHLIRLIPYTNSLRL